MNIVIKTSNADRLEAAINNAQSRANVRLASLVELNDTIRSIESKLFPLITKQDLKGALFTVDVNAQKFANCYKGIPQTTLLEIKFTGTGWNLLDVKRTPCGTKEVSWLNASDYTLTAYR